ncbi:Serine/threonine-protein kinase SAPK2-like protein [Drosera capensis]
MGGYHKQTSKTNDLVNSSQSLEEICAIIQEARTPGQGPKIGGVLIGGSLDVDDPDADTDMVDDMKASGDFVVDYEAMN